MDSSSDSDQVTLWVVCCMAFLGFFLLGELLLAAGIIFNPRVHLAWGGVAVDDSQDPKMVRVHMKQSKTDQLGEDEVRPMSSRCTRGLCSGPWDSIWRILPERNNGTYMKSGVYCKVPQDPGGSWFPPAPVRWPQLQDWGGNRGCSGRS